MSRKFTKNYYYNKTSILKLIYLYDYINKTSFLDELQTKIHQGVFSSLQRKTEVLSDIYSKLNPNLIKLELPFGFVWIFDDHLTVYFKIDSDLDEFFEFFSKLESDYQIKWFSIELFDKNIKIFEFFSKTSLLRSYRDEVFSPRVVGNKESLTKIKTMKFDFEKKAFLPLLKPYNTKNLKLVVYFHKKNV